MLRVKGDLFSGSFACVGIEIGVNDQDGPLGHCALCEFWWLADLTAARSRRHSNRLRLGFNQQVGKSIARRLLRLQRKPRVTLDSRSSPSLRRGYSLSPASWLSDPGDAIACDVVTAAVLLLASAGVPTSVGWNL